MREFFLHYFSLMRINRYAFLSRLDPFLHEHLLFIRTPDVL